MRSGRGRAVVWRSPAALLFAVLLLPTLLRCRDEERPSFYTWNDNRPQLYFRVVTPSGLNLRSEASVQSDIVTTLPFDTIGRVLDQTSSVEIIQGRHGFWMRTEVKGRKGWIFSGFVITSTNIGDLSPTNLETDPERLPLIEASLLQGSHSVEKLELPAFVVEGYAFAGRENPTSEQLKTAEAYSQYCGLPVSLVAFHSKNTGRLYAWRAYSEQILKRDYPLPGMVTTMGIVCNCCCAGGAERYYAFEEDHVAAIPLHLHPSKKASCFYSNAPYGPIQPAVEVRHSANVLYTLVKVPICEPTPEQNALLEKGEELLVEDVRLFSSISFTRLEVTAFGFKLIRRQVASVPDEFRAEWDQAELLEEP